MSKETENILNHLLFHKAIVRESDHELNIDNYVSLLEKVDEGMHVIIEDPIEKAVAIAFQLVMENRYDPWALDLVEFTKLYLKRIKAEEDINFIIAGRIIHMAWSVLKLQSEKVLADVDKTEEVEEFYFEGWDTSDLYQEPEDVDYSQLVMQSEAPIIQEAVRGNDVRPVSLISLIEAFDEARQEIALKNHIKKFLDNAPKEKPVKIGEKLHQENLEENISITWQRICKFNGSRIPISQIWNSDPLDRVRVFEASLFLAKMHKIELRQSRFPYGEITIKNIESLEPQEIQEVPVQVIGEEETIIDEIEDEHGLPIENLAVV